MDGETKVFLERCKVDHELVMKLILSKDIKHTLTEEGFNLPDWFYKHLEKNIQKIREYVTDQIHVLEMKNQSMQFLRSAPTSGNGPHW
ncbi:TPA: hypothetical protein ACLBZX_003239 [Bacillus cereus]|uniref:hypothetical protein n=1 Tax=Bacillus cereus TaxID=1396 RepID=UPI0010BDD992|nr:hypothetical protein [Bacillus cereus]TKH48518.1 hypothetical protein FC677_29055 [Bacillus cereus]